MQSYNSSADVIENIVEKNNIVIELDDHDRHILQKSAPVLCIANQSLEYIDEIVLMQLFQNEEKPFKIIGAEKKFDPNLKDFILNIELQPLQQEEYVRRLYKQLSRAKEEGISVCLVLHFTDKAIDTAVRNQYLNRLMKAILKVKMPIIPIRIKAPFPDFVRPRIGK